MERGQNHLKTPLNAFGEHVDGPRGKDGGIGT